MIAVSLYEVKYTTPALLREKFIPWTSRDEQTPVRGGYLCIIVWYKLDAIGASRCIQAELYKTFVYSLVR